MNSINALLNDIFVSEARVFFIVVALLIGVDQQPMLNLKEIFVKRSKMKTP